MKIYFTDQKKHFERHLRVLKNTPVMEYNKAHLSEKVSTISIASQQIDYQILFDYKIFPESIITHLAEWNLEGRNMQVGDTIVQQVFIPPIKILSQKIIFGARINEIIDEPTRKGFSYETLHGHAERGISTFTIEQEDGNYLFKIHTFSQPGNFLSKLLGPVFTRPYQKFSTGRALMNVKQQLEK